MERSYILNTDTGEVVFEGTKQECREMMDELVAHYTQGECWQWLDENGNHFYDLGTVYMFND